MNSSQPITFYETDPRIKLLSYSSLLQLHKCPRKFQLYRLNATEDEMSNEASINQNVTFAYGHVVGEGIQQVMEGRNETAILFNAFLGWHADLEDRNEKQNKSFYLAVAAIQRFISLRANGFLEDYELLHYNGKPATELSFRIRLPGGYLMRGSVDAVLRHRITGEVLILECKTSSTTNLNAATFKNSSQAVGYSVILDVICPGLSSYKVLYLVYLTKTMDYEQLPFTKSYLQRATWIQELLLDVETIQLYERTGVYPMRGESCFDFFRECEYLQVCSLKTSHLTKPLPEELYESIDTKVYDVELTLVDLIEGQLNKE
jgi:hypothetical protein